MTTSQLRNDITVTKVTNEIQMIESLEENLNYIRWLLTEDYTETHIAQSIFMLISNLRSDIDRQANREAIQRKNLLNHRYMEGSA
jgi:hypothetical protein